MRLLYLWLVFELMTSHANAFTVVLDTGHTKLRPGSMSAAGRPEYGFNLALSAAIAKQLETQGIMVQRVAADGEEIALAARAAGTENADLFVSIHHDSIKQEWIDAGWRNEFAGFAVFASRKNAKVRLSEACARKVGQTLVAAGETPSRYHAAEVQGENRPFFDAAAGGHYFDDLVVLKKAKSAAILIEAGVIANPTEEIRLSKGATTSVLARAITAGIVGCLSTQGYVKY